MPIDLTSTLGTIGTVLALGMFLAQIEQIKLNLKGAKGPVVMPSLITLNCVVWMIYAALKAPPDWFLFVANLPGPILGPISLGTAISNRQKG